MLQSGSDDSLDVVGGGGRRGDFSTVGLMLRETRERYGLTLRDVANALRIRVVYLHALEEGRFADLPGRPYVIGFLRSYAEYFSLDGDEVVRRYREERADAGKPARLVFPEPPPETKFPIAAMLAIAVVATIVGYGGWQLLGSKSPESRPMVAEVPTELTLEADRAENEIAELANEHAADASMLAVATADATATISRSIGSSAEPELAKELGQDSLDIVADMPAAEPPRDSGGSVIEFSSASAASIPVDEPPYGDPGAAAAVAAAQPLSPSLLGFPNAGEITVPSDLASLDPAERMAAAAGGIQLAAIEETATTIYGDVNVDARVILRATADCWIEIKDASGREVFTRLMKVGEIYKVPNRDDLLLRMGNAGGLEVLVDGRALPLLGAPGEVMRNVSLAPTALLAPL